MLFGINFLIQVLNSHKILRTERENGKEKQFTHLFFKYLHKKRLYSLFFNIYRKVMFLTIIIFTSFCLFFLTVSTFLYN